MTTIDEMLRSAQPSVQEEVEHRQVIRLKTSAWHDSKGLHIRRDLTTLVRKSKGHQILDEECSMVGADEAMDRITNLDDCEDGVYLVGTCDESRDWETGYIDGYNLKLVPYENP